MNKVVLMGRLTRDPNVKYTQSNEPIAVARFSLTVNRKTKKKNTQKYTKNKRSGRMAKKKRRFELNRKTYDRVRKMDHNMMQDYVADVYERGYTDGMNQNKGLSPEEMKEKIMAIKGIGEKKADMIVKTLSNT